MSKTKKFVNRYDPSDADTARREFLKSAGKFSVLVPPAMTFLLTTTMTSSAIADSVVYSNLANQGPPPPAEDQDYEGKGAPR